MGPVYFALLASLLAAGSALAAPPVFSHKEHLDRGLVCSSCHDTSAATGVPPPKAASCSKCHQDGAPDYAPFPKLPSPNAVFSHRTHTQKLDCVACHAGIAQDKPITAGAPVLPADACMSCHNDLRVPVSATACATCHGEDRKTIRPADHGPNWLQTHGASAAWRLDDGMHGQDCRQCHTKSSCTECHDQMQPRNHTGLWRMQAHGIAAQWDRDSCKTCHEVSTCVRCHQSTQPMNHTGPWLQEHGLVAGSRVSESCSVCHKPQYCAACHNRPARQR